MKNMKVFIVTYKRPKVFNETLDRLFNYTDFKLIKNTEVVVINNHSDFHMDEQFKDKVTVLHNMTRPDWDVGNLSRNWNECLIHGFEDLKNPAARIVVTMQNDIVLHPNWATNLLKLHQKYTFVTGILGDNIVSYLPEAVVKIGLWDERFTCPSHKEADYYLRALIYNKDKSIICDTIHNRLLNYHDYLPLDINEYRGGDPDWRAQTKLTTDSREAWYQATQIFYWKWKDTWKTQPAYFGWVNGWSSEFIETPPIPSEKVNFCLYPYFEKNIELHNKNYVGWRTGDLWFDCESFDKRTNKFGDIDVHPFNEGERFRK
tara:strand:- start:13398 stop:14348 length:951 start_codon:yes stop_codon:yes gene_type:complete